MRFVRLPLLEALVQRRSPEIERRLCRTLLVAVQHLLETTGSLLEALLRLGLRPENVFVLGKAYSSNKNVVDRLRACGLSVDGGTLPAQPGRFDEVFQADVERLWNRALQRLTRSEFIHVAVLDDGGRCISALPTGVHRLASVSGVEQTTGGLVGGGNSHAIRVVEVATSAAKRVLESPMISRAILRRLPPLDSGARFGVIGVGNVGSAIVSHLLDRGSNVFAFDLDSSRSRAFPSVRAVDSLAELLWESEFVLGCSGDDVFATAPKIEWRQGETILASCSSQDREFRSLLTTAVESGYLANWTPVGMAGLRIGAAGVRILRGGFPLNFDGSLESVPSREIQLTRALLLGGMLQAVLCAHGHDLEVPGGRMLDPRFQLWVAREWAASTRNCAADWTLETTPETASEAWIAERSGGTPEDTAALRSALDLD